MADEKTKSISQSSKKAPERVAVPVSKTTVEEDDDDVSDLDDVLDDFANPRPTHQPAKSSIAESKVKEPEEEEEGLDDDFAAQLSAGMEQLMREISGGGGDKVDDKEMSPEEMNKMLEETFGKLLDSQAMPGEAVAAAAAGSGSAAGAAPPGGFQEQIRATMDKLKDSSDNVRSEVSDTANQDMLQQMMSQMGDMGDSEGFQNLLEGMMEQLMSKDVLYEPMKDLESKFPDYLKEHKDKLSPEDYDRYSKQHDYIKQIVAKFEAPGFDEKSEEQGKEVVDLMQKMQDCGAPPPEIMGEAAQGLELGEDGLPKLPPGADLENCVIS